MKKKAFLIVAAVACVSVPMSCVSLPVLPPTKVTPVREATVPMQLCWLETAGTQGPGAFGASGRTKTDVWQATTSALLVRHPKGDLLIDSGFSVHAEEEKAELGAWRRFVFGQTAGRNRTRGNLRQMLESLGAVDLRAIIISHAHPDHLGGVEQLPKVPVWLAAEEVAFIESDDRGVVIPAQARAVKGRMVGLSFESGPYLTYGSSHDVFGDGSVVIVPTFGHTPGSVATFVNLPGHRVVHVGDLINLRESIDRHVPKGRLMRALTDQDAEATDFQVAKLVELHANAPDVQILPAHDRAEWEKLFGPTPVGSPPKCVGSK